jgi:5'-methylthioadenosine phosphorylase
MVKVGIIGGSNLFNSLVLENGKIDKEREVLAIEKNGFTFIQRHGVKNVPPHKINHVANLTYLKDKGISSVIAIASVGSLKKEIIPGSVLTVKDFISFYNITTSDNEKRMHITPVFDSELTKILQNDSEIENKGVIYWQTTGPRFETPAEINLMKQFADVVGMTVASECTIAAELGLKYAAVCVVDNYCNGISDLKLDLAVFEKLVEKNREKTDRVIRRLLNVFVD